MVLSNIQLMLRRLAVVDTVVLLVMTTNTNALQDIKGIGTLSCPADDYQANPCIPSFQNNNPFACLDTSCSVDIFNLPEFTSDVVTIPILCDCIEILNCPDSCTFIEDDSIEHNNPNMPSDSPITQPSNQFDTMNFGPGVVGTLSCPIDDYTIQPCLPVDLDGDCSPEDCAFFSILGSFTETLDPTFQNFVIPIPCTCLTAVDCPDTCTFQEVELDQTSLNTTSFTGPGIVTCPFDDLIIQPCLPTLSDDDSGVCDDCDNSYLNFQLPDFNEDVLEIGIPLSCSCIEVSGCPSTCTFEAVDDRSPIQPIGTMDFGPGVVGTISCPIADYAVQPCIPVDLDGDCSPEDCAFYSGLGSFVETLDPTFQNFVIPVPCTCLTAVDCPDTCTFEEAETNPTLLNTTSFTGPGIVTCPFNDLITRPCLPSFSDDNSGVCDDCDGSYLNFQLPDFTSDVLEIEIPLACSCIEVSGCPSTCTFEDVDDRSPVQPIGTMDFGPGVVGTLSCPIVDYTVQPCFPVDLDGDCSPEDCAFFSFLDSFTETLDPTFQSFVIPIPCTCLTAIDCPDTCTFHEAEIDPTSSNTTSFSGPGIVTCPFDDLIVRPCLPTLYDDNSTGVCDDCDASYINFQFPDFTADVLEIEIPLVCSCIKVNGCPSTCTFEAVDDRSPMQPIGTTDFGPGAIGTLSCPTADYAVQPCIPVDLDGDCSPEDCAFYSSIGSFIETIDPTLQNVVIPIPCTCLTAVDCPDTCTFQEAEESDSMSLNTTSFTGPGTVTCPLVDLILHPCLPSLYDDNSTVVCDDCDQGLIFQFPDFASDVLEIEIPLVCSCIQVSGCPSTCTFEAGEPIIIDVPTVSPAIPETPEGPSAPLTPAPMGSPSPDSSITLAPVVSLTDEGTSAPTTEPVTNENSAPTKEPTDDDTTSSPVTEVDDITAVPTMSPSSEEIESNTISPSDANSIDSQVDISTTQPSTISPTISPMTDNTITSLSDNTERDTSSSVKKFTPTLVVILFATSSLFVTIL